MNAKHMIFCVAAGLALTGAVSTANAAWLAPSGGWQENYQASGGVTPDAATPAWTNSGGYQSGDSTADNYSAVVTDSITSEQTLYLGNTAASGNRFPRYILTTSGVGAGAYSDKVTLAFRFRLVDGTSPEQQWAFAVDRPGDAAVIPTTTHSVNLTFRTNKIQDGNTNIQYDAALGTDWHDARLLFDVAANTASLYLDGSPTAAITVTGTVYSGLYNDTWFGDGMGQVLGKAEVSYFRWTNNELAAVPEPASMGLLALGGSLLMMKRRRKVA